MNCIINKEQAKLLRKSGQILKDALIEVQKMVKPGVSTLSLDKLAERFIRDHNAVPSFKNYVVSGLDPYPASLCVSINDEIVHGIPSDKRILKVGDIVSLDLGVNFQGLFTDAAVTVPVGEVDPEIVRLIEVTKECLDRGIDAAALGNHIGAIGDSIQLYAEKNGFSVVRDLVGHGVGLKPHTEPYVPNYGKKTEGPLIEEGMALAIEPMLTNGSYKIKTNPDGWSISTIDGSIAAHFEDTVLIEEGVAVVVTR